MAAGQKGHPTEELPPVVQNRGLFSDYYLTELVWDDEFFRGSAKDAEPVWLAIKSLYEKVKPQLPTANEAQTEQLFIRPVLDLLGHRGLYAVQPSVPSAEGPRRPDFAFFGSIDGKEHAEATCKGKVEYFAKALAIGDAKQWDRSLDRKRKGAGDAFTNANPSYQIDFYLRATDRKWGILTNGRRWRLYHRDTSYRMNVFYEVDLVALLEEYDESFLYFYAFFHKDAFTTGFLDRVLRGSRDYAGKLGDELKENVYEALRLLAEGLLRCPDNGLREDDLDEVRANTFVLIYRLLFLFYAEDRGLLPMENPHYRTSYSLRGWAQEIADKLEEGHSFSPTTYGSWMKLSELCRIVNEGDAHLRVPPYNGGLFDVAKHLLLVRCKIGDLYLASAVDRLARAEAAGRTGRGPVSYRDLDIRHIGAVYEGLLEHRLRVAHQDLAVVKDGGKEKFVPVAKLGNKRPLKTHRAGEVYLETDKGERKATGSYYTPDYIVKYIVEHTLGPLVEEKHKKIEEERHVLEEKVKGSRGYDREVYERKLAEIGNRLIEEILSIKVLDPAMGSGHFLVEAVDFLARELIRALGESPEELEEEEVRWAGREVVERCIFGVDVNPLAVELAKLSLWISTVAKDRPLSFLDHHLRLGNSLIGAWVKDLGRLPARSKKDKAAQIGEHVVGLFEGKLKERLPVVLGEVMELLRKPSDKVEDIREKETLYEHILNMLQPFKEVANVWVSTYFGNEADRTDYENALLKLSDPPTVWEREVREQPWFAKTQEMVAARHFFHWELEFPEVFFEKTGQRKRNPGFDAVIGNPPYVRSVRLKEDDPEGWVFYASRFRAASKREYDVYLCFVEQGHALLSTQGRFGMIMPNKWFTTRVGETLRCLLAEARAVDHVVDFGSFQVFDDVTAYTCLLFLTGAPSEEVEAAVLLDSGSSPTTLPNGDGSWQISAVPTARLGGEPWHFLPEDTGDFWKKLQNHPRLEDVAVVFKGTGTSADHVFFMERRADGFYSRFVDETVELESELMRPALTGQDIDRYAFRRDNWLLFPYAIQGDRAALIPPDEMSTRYPKAWAYLSRPQIRTALEGRDRGEFRTREDWYAFGRPQNLHLLGEAKVVLPDVGARGEFAYDPEGRYIIDTAYGVVPQGQVRFSLLSLTAVLNSSLLTMFLQHTGTDLRGGYFRMKTSYLNPFPIPRIAFTTPPAKRTQLVEEGKRLYREALERGRHGSGLEGHRKEGSV